MVGDTLAGNGSVEHRLAIDLRVVEERVAIDLEVVFEIGIAVRVKVCAPIAAEGDAYGNEGITAGQTDLAIVLEVGKDQAGLIRAYGQVGVPTCMLRSIENDLRARRRRKGDGDREERWRE
jgi:hypothetical protein